MAILASKIITTAIKVGLFGALSDDHWIKNLMFKVLR